MYISTRALGLALALSAAPFAAHAEETPEQNTAKKADTSFAIGEIVVTARGHGGGGPKTSLRQSICWAAMSRNAPMSIIFISCWAMCRACN